MLMLDLGVIYGAGVIHEEFVVVDREWPPRVARIPKRKYVGLYEDMGYANYWNDIMKAFEETRYGKI